MKLYLNQFIQVEISPLKEKMDSIYSCDYNSFSWFCLLPKFQKNKNHLTDNTPLQTSQILPKKEITNNISEDYSKIIDSIKKNDLENAYDLIVSKNCESKEIDLLVKQI